MWLNQGKFKQNGGCGYILKPEYMIKDNTPKSPPIQMQLHVLGGACIPKAGGATAGLVIAPYLQIEICGTADDNAKKSTSIVQNNGFDPIWNQKFSFEIKQPDVTMLLIKCLDANSYKGSDFIGYCSYPISALREGIRVMQLHDKDGSTKGDFAFSKLFVGISFRAMPERTKGLEISLESATLIDL